MDSSSSNNTSRTTRSTSPSGQADQQQDGVCIGSRSTRQAALVSQVSVGTNIDIYWPLDDAYYPARVVGERAAAAEGSSSSSSSTSAGVAIFTVIYSDGTVETLNLNQEKFRVLDGDAKFLEESAGTSSSAAAAAAGGGSNQDFKVAAATTTTPFAVTNNAAATTTSTATDTASHQVGSRYDANIPRFNASSEHLSDDVYVSILSYMSNISDMAAFSRTCKRIHLLWNNATLSEQLFEKLFHSRFGNDACSWAGVLTNNAATASKPNNQSTISSVGGGEEKMSYWHNVWKDMHQLRRALTLEGTPVYMNEGFNKRTKEQMCQLIKAFTGSGSPWKQEEEEEEEDQKSASSSSAGTKRKHNARDMRRTMGILTEREEDEAIFYDNPSYAPDPNGRYCFGYFGLTSMNVPRSTASTNSTTNGPPVAVWGDFPGVRIFDSPEDVMYDREMSRSQRSARRSVAVTSPQSRPCVSVANSDGEGLVLAVLVSPFADQQAEVGETCPCLFLGMSSGMVISVGAATNETGQTTYATISAVEDSHENEVTSLALVRNPNMTGDDGPESHMLASSSVDGKVLVYPHAFTPSEQYSLNINFPACTPNQPIFSIASTLVTPSRETGTSVILASSDQNGRITLWYAKKDELRVAAESYSFSSLGTTRHSQREDIIATKMSFLHNNILVTGSNHGDVRIWRLQVAARDGGWSDRLEAKLVSFHRMSAAHVGTIESIENFGDIILTSGGFDGLLKGWDLNSGRLLGVLSCHAGRSPSSSASQSSSGRSGKQIMSSVVGSVLWNKSLVSLCRDGTLQKWDYEALVEKHNTTDVGRSSNATENDWLSSFISPVAVRGPTKGGGSKRKQNLRSMEELKTVMSKTGRGSSVMQQRMRLAIFRAAVAVALQPDRKDREFLGADGKLYESTKKAFSRYSGLHACASCRGHAQGAFFCRLVRAHELSASSLAEVRGLLKVQKEEPRASKKSAQESAQSLSVLESIAEEKRKSPNKQVTDTLKDDEEWQCHRCTTVNDVADRKCRTCWASRRKIPTKASEKNKKVGKMTTPAQGDGRNLVSWHCHRCTFENAGSDRSCVMCEAVKKCNA